MSWWLSLLMASYAAFAEVPKGGLATENAAVKAAETILVDSYGEGVLTQRPFRAKLDGEYWIIDGTLHCPKGSVCKGGKAHCECGTRAPHRRVHAVAGVR